MSEIVDATDGGITDRDYEDKIKEAFRQLGGGGWGGLIALLL